MSSGQLFATMLLHIPYSERLVYPKGRTQAYELTSPGSVIKHNRFNIILVFSGEVEVEIFLSDKVIRAQQNCILALRILASTVFFLCLTSKHCALQSHKMPLIP